MNINFVLDTSAVFAFLENEEGADTVEALFEKADAGAASIYISFVTVMEIYYITIQKKGATAALERIDALQTLPVECVESDWKIGKIAGELKAAHRISFADSWVAALAKNVDATLVHKDPEFESVENQINELKLTYKRSNG